MKGEYSAVFTRIAPGLSANDSLDNELISAAIDEADRPPGAAFRDKGRLGAGSGGMFRSSGQAGLEEVRGALGGHLEDCTR